MKATRRLDLLATIGGVLAVVVTGCIGIAVIRDIVRCGWIAITGLPYSMTDIVLLSPAASLCLILPIGGQSLILIILFIRWRMAAAASNDRAASELHIRVTEIAFPQARLAKAYALVVLASLAVITIGASMSHGIGVVFMDERAPIIMTAVAAFLLAVAGRVGQEEKMRFAEVVKQYVCVFLFGVLGLSLLVCWLVFVNKMQIPMYVSFLDIVIALMAPAPLFVWAVHAYERRQSGKRNVIRIAFLILSGMILSVYTYYSLATECGSSITDARSLMSAVGFLVPVGLLGWSIHTYRRAWNSAAAEGERSDPEVRFCASEADRREAIRRALGVAGGSVICLTALGVGLMCLALLAER